MKPQRLNQQQLRLVIFVLIGLLTVVLAWAIFTATTFTALVTTGQLKLAVVPSDSSIKIDNSGASSGTLQLAPGSHTITVSRSGFATKTVTVTIQLKQLGTESVVLQANSQEGLDYLAAHPEEQQAGEGATGAEVNQVGQQITDANPLIKLLPYQGADFQINAGVSHKHPGQATAVGIYIAASSTAGQQHALSWIKAQGYNPSDYEIIYEGN
jgi:hypothetical protein